MKPWNSEFSRDAKILLGFGEKVQILANLLFSAKIWSENAKIWKSLKKPKFSILLWVFFGNIKITTLYHKNYHKYLSKTKGEKVEMARNPRDSGTVRRERGSNSPPLGYESDVLPLRHRSLHCLLEGLLELYLNYIVSLSVFSLSAEFSLWATVDWQQSQ